MIISNPIFRKIAATLLGFLIIIYVGNQIYSIFYEGVSTQTALYSQIEDTIEIDAWVVREEITIENTQSGVLSYRISDGERVTKNSSIADLYSNQETIDNQFAIEQLEEEIANLELLINSSNNYTSTQTEITSQINSSLTNILIANQKQNYDDVSDSTANLYYYINQKSLITEEISVDVFEEKINELEAEKTSLEMVTSDRIGYVNCPKTGYFMSYLDGYENSFDYDDVENITVSEINSVTKYESDDDTIGKVITSFNWYVVAVIDEQQKIKIEDISSVYLNVSTSSGEKVPADIVSINYDSETGDYALVLKCSYSNAQLLAMRNETIQVVVKTYTGVLVNEKYIRFQNVVTTTTDEDGNTVETVTENVKGVYVKYGEIISFVQVFSDITINGYAVCKTSLSDEEQKLLVTTNTIDVYDEIVTETINIYDGKTVS
ncbi:MAG: HlyD family efflux transporter periplasmic adaptor subunit [Clostridia bacterium]